MNIYLKSFKPEFLQVEHTNFKKKVNVELLHLYLKMLKRMPWCQSVMVPSIGLFVGQSVPISLIVTWGLALILLECIRSAYAFKIEPDYKQVNLRPVMLRLVVLSLLAGFLHGVSLLLFIPYLSEVDQSLLYIVQFLNIIGSFTIPTFIVYGCYPLTILTHNCVKQG